jgi:hypothetical protein
MRPNTPLGTVLLVGALFSALPAALALEGAEGVTAVSSRVSGDYVRVKLPDGSLKPEGYAFGNGGYWGSPVSDDTITKLGFMDVARVIAVPLSKRNYVPDRDPNTTKLLIMVYWGTTDTPEPASESSAYQTFGTEMQEATLLQNSGGGFGAVAAGDSMMSAALQFIKMEESRRARIDFKNAIMLGYDSPDGNSLIGTAYGNQLQFTALRNARNDLVQEIETRRYFVVLMAYDFQLMWKQKKHELLWETRFSINQPRNDFGKALPVMANYASDYFGEESHGLVRQPVPAGRVEIREPTLIELLLPKN